MYNNQTVIQETIDSVIRQTYNNWELLLIDDNSSDNTLQIVEPIVANNPQIKLFKHSSNKGAAEARNLGTKMASGTHIAFLDADDLWHEDKLQSQIQILSSSADVCFGSYEWVDPKGNSLQTKVYALKSLSYDKLLKANYIGNLTGIYNCEKLGKIYTKDLKKRQDWLLWLEALRRSDKPAVGLPETVAYYRKSSGSLSSNKMGLIKHNFNVYRKGLDYSFVKSAFYLVQFLYEHLFVKKRLIKPIN